MNSPSLQFIVVEGAIGVGKTTLSRRLARTYNAELVLEQPEDNPFLQRFYEDPERTALPVQLSFLLQRTRQLSEIRQTSLFHSVRVSDFMMEKDRLFAELTLKDDEFALYDKIYHKFYQERLVPDLVIYLQASVSTLLKRIANRGIVYEQWITPEYLQRLHEKYMKFFQHYDASPLLVVNTENLDLAASEQDYQMLLKTMVNVKQGRFYVHPVEENL